MITFLQEDQTTIANIKAENKFNKINKTGKILAKVDFWNKSNEDGIYGEYNRLNKYVIDKYNFKYDLDLYRNILKDDFVVPIKEIKVDGINNLLEELNNFYKKSMESEVEDFRLFDSDGVDSLISDVVDNFMRDYNYLIRK